MQSFAMRCFVTGRKGAKPAALRFGSKTLAANKDGTFTLATSQVVEAFRSGYHVEPVRAPGRSAIGRRTLSNEPAVPASYYYKSRAELREIAAGRRKPAGAR
jgi:hypothetical protein